MKNKLNKIILITSSISVVLILTLAILGSVNRVGYLSAFTLKLDKNGIYHYSFSMKYYSKIFRNSDIYGVYIDTNKTMQDNNFIKEIKFNEKGSPFGNLISTKELRFDDKIDNTNYKLKIKPSLIIIFCTILSIILVYLIILKYKIKIKCFYLKHKNYIFISYSIIVILLILFVIINVNIRKTVALTDAELIAESKAGYVYKGRIEEHKKEDNKLLYRNNDSIEINNINNIKYYGYALEITNKPIGSWHSTNIYYTDNNTFIISNESTNQNAYSYNIQVPTYVEDTYKITILAKQLPQTGNIFWHLNGYNNFKEITKKEVSNDYIVLTDTRAVYSPAGGVLDLHFIMPYGVTEIESIKIESLNTTFNIENNYIVFTLQNKANNLEVNYWLTSSPILNYILLILALPVLNFIFILFNKYIKSDKIFSIVIFGFGIVLFIFQLWLCFPGFYNYPDGYAIMSEAVAGKYSNWFPFLIPLTLNFLYKIFGYHDFYLFFINMFLWYIGLTIIVYSLYYKFKNRYLILLFFISFLANIFFPNISHLKDITATLFFFFAVSIMIFKEIVKINNKILNVIITLLIYICLLFALLWRHNFIVTIYPIFIYLVYEYLKKINTIKYFFIKFCSIMLIIAFILIFMVRIPPYLFTESYNTPNSGYLPGFMIGLQIAGCAVPANDGSLIPDSWYLENKTFEDLKQQYNVDNVISDYLFMYNNKILKVPLYKDRKAFRDVLFKYIKKYPKNYIKHMLNYSYTIIGNSTEKSIVFVTPIHLQYSLENIGVEFDKNKFNIYSFLFNNKLFIPIIYFLIISIIIFFVAGFIWIFRPNIRNNLLLLSFSLSFSSVATAVIVSLFTPSPTYRYVSPVVIISLLSLLSFILFIIYDFRTKLIINKK